MITILVCFFAYFLFCGLACLLGFFFEQSIKQANKAYKNKQQDNNNNVTTITTPPPPPPTTT